MEEKKKIKQKTFADDFAHLKLFVFDRTCLQTLSGDSLLLWQHLTEDKA